MENRVKKQVNIMGVILLGIFSHVLLAVPKTPNVEGLAYLNTLSNQKAACFAKINGKLASSPSNEEKILNNQEQLAICYKKIVIDLATKFYPDGHFGKNIEEEIQAIIDRQQNLLNKITHCPASKEEGCHFYEKYDALSGTVDYLNETIEMMALNIGEGYPEFNPEKWLKKWEAIV